MNIPKIVKMILVALPPPAAGAGAAAAAALVVVGAAETGVEAGISAAACPQEAQNLAPGSSLPPHCAQNAMEYLLEAAHLGLAGALRQVTIRTGVLQRRRCHPR